MCRKSWESPAGPGPGGAHGREVNALQGADAQLGGGLRCRGEWVNPPPGLGDANCCCWGCRELCNSRGVGRRRQWGGLEGFLMVIEAWNHSTAGLEGSGGAPSALPGHGLPRAHPQLQGWGTHRPSGEGCPPHHLTYFSPISDRARRNGFKPRCPRNASLFLSIGPEADLG